MTIYLLEYIWLGGNDEIRSKIRTYDSPDFIQKPADIPPWNYDGSSTGQAEGTASEVHLKPVAICHHPFLPNSLALIVLCETMDAAGQPHPSNRRAPAQSLFTKFAAEKPWYGFEQEYFILDPKTGLPLGFKNQEQGPFYCSNGGARAFGRTLAEDHMLACLECGLHISGINAEVAPGQWEFQIGPVEGIQAADELILARFLLERLSEKHEVAISYEPKPLGPSYNGSGCHTNFSTEAMRQDGGLAVIEAAMPKLAAKHKEHIAVYGKDNNLRLTGLHETSSMDTFSYGIGNRQASVRIGTDTQRQGKGYFEDRRPAANINPYDVASLILQTCCE